MKTKSIAKLSIILWSIVLVIAVSLIAVCAVSFNNGRSPFGMSFLGFFGSDRSSFVSVKEETITVPVNSLDIQWISGETTVFKSTDNSVRIVQKANQDFPQGELFTYSESGGKLTVKDQRGRGWNFFNFGMRGGSDLELYLPEKEYDAFVGNFTSSNFSADLLNAKKIQMNTVSGRVSFTGKSNDIKVNTISGGVELKDSTAEKIDVNTTSGNITLDNCRVSGILHAYSTSGKIMGQNAAASELSLETTSGGMDMAGEFTTIRFSTTSGRMRVASTRMISSLDARSVSGSLTLTLPENDGFTASFNKVSGGFHCNFPTVQNGKDYVYQSGAAKISVKSTSGSFTIERGIS